MDIKGCSFASFVITNYSWNRLSLKKQKKIYKEAGVKFRKQFDEELKAIWKHDKTYSAEGRGVIRLSIQ